MTDELTFSNTPNRPIEVDGHIYWISRSVTVLAVLIFVHNDQLYVPLGKRGIDLPEEQGKWGLPGGYLDYDETLTEAVMREVYEETGLNLPKLMAENKFTGDLETPFRISSRPRRLQNVSMRFPLMLFVDELPSLSPKVSAGEVEDIRWVPVPDAIAMLLAFNHHDVIQDCLDNYFHWEKT